MLITPSVSSPPTPSPTPSISSFPTPSLTPSISTPIEIFVVSDEDVPSHINYDTTNNEIVPVVMYEADLDAYRPNNTPKKIFLRHVKNSKRRKPK